MSTGSKSILIFEDDIDLAIQWKVTLRGHGFHVAHACTVEEALDYCNQIQFDAIVMDIFLVDASGKQISKAGMTLLNYLRTPILGKTPKWGVSVPIIAVTGSPSLNGFDVLRVALSMGSSTALRKPFSPQLLTQTVMGLVA